MSLLKYYLSDAVTGEVPFTGDSYARRLAVTTTFIGTLTLSAGSGGGTDSGSHRPIGGPVGGYAGPTPTGVYTVKVPITSGNANCDIRVYLIRLSGSTIQASVVSDWRPASAGTETFSFTNPALGTWSSGQRFVVRIEIRNNATHGGSQSVTYAVNTIDAEVQTQFSTAIVHEGASAASAGASSSANLIAAPVTRHGSASASAGASGSAEASFVLAGRAHATPKALTKKADLYHKPQSLFAFATTSADLTRAQPSGVARSRAWATSTANLSEPPGSGAKRLSQATAVVAYLGDPDGRISQAVVLAAAYIPTTRQGSADAHAGATTEAHLQPAVFDGTVHEGAASVSASAKAIYASLLHAPDGPDARISQATAVVAYLPGNIAMELSQATALVAYIHQAGVVIGEASVQATAQTDSNLSKHVDWGGWSETYENEFRPPDLNGIADSVGTATAVANLVIETTTGGLARSKASASADAVGTLIRGPQVSAKARAITRAEFSRVAGDGLIYIHDDANGGPETEVDGAIDATQTEIEVVSSDGIVVGSLLQVGDELVKVVAVSGTTLTVVRGVEGSIAAAHQSGTVVRRLLLRIPIELLYEGEDLMPITLFSGVSFKSSAGLSPGTCEVRLRDQDREFLLGRELVLLIDGVRQWAGYLSRVGRGYYSTAVEDGYLKLEGVDYNVLFQKRFLFDRNVPTQTELRSFPSGTYDDVIIRDYIPRYTDLPADGVNLARVERVGSPSHDVDISGSAGWSVGNFLRHIRFHTGAIDYIDPDKFLIHTDVDTPNARFGISDRPRQGEVGCRDLEIDFDGTHLRNDAMVWGAGQGSDNVVFARTTDAPSITEHGLWQVGQFNAGVWRQNTVNRISESFVYGSPQNKRGGKDDAVSVRCVIFQTGLRVADKARVRSAVFGYDDVLPVREMEITFPTPRNAQFALVLSHEIDSPWSTFEPWWPKFDLDLDVPEIEIDLDLPDIPDFWCDLFEAEEKRPGPFAVAGSFSNLDNSGQMPAHQIRVGHFDSHVYIENGQNFVKRNWHDSYTCTMQGGDLRHRLLMEWTDLYRYTFGSAWIEAEGELEESHTKKFGRASADYGPEGEPGREYYIIVDLQIEVFAKKIARPKPYWLGGFFLNAGLPWDSDSFPVSFGYIREPTFTCQTDPWRTGIVIWSGDIPLEHGPNGSYGMRNDVRASIGPFMEGGVWNPVVSIPSVPAGEALDVDVRAKIIDVNYAYAMSHAIAIRRKRDDGTDCSDGFPLAGPVTGAPLQRTNHPSGEEYRFPTAYVPKSTVVYVDGVFQRPGHDYEETSPSGGLIRFEEAPSASADVRGNYRAAGLDFVDAGGLGLELPTHAGPVTSAFGPQASFWPPREWHGQYHEHFHNGVDFGVGVGTPIYAAQDGVAAAVHDHGGGIMVVLHHKPGVQTVYAHLAARAVGNNEFVEKGTLIGWSGASGIVTGPHLHWGLVVSGTPEDPMGYLG